MQGFTNFLFVPGSRADRFEKALSSGTDLICIDLEDSVPAGEKDMARQAAIDSLKNLDKNRVAIRINGMMTAHGLADLLAIAASDAKPALVFIPMVESATEVGIVHNVLGNSVAGLVPLIETVKGLRAGDAIAAASGVTAMMFGGGDFSSELGTKLEWEPMLAARGEFILCCASAQVAAIDVPYIDMDNAEGFAEECARIKAMGFHAKAAIHPRQVETIAQAMRPTDAEIAEAREAVTAYEAAGERAIKYKGRMLEAPVMRRYQTILASAGN